jgi:hypothetical protein
MQFGESLARLAADIATGHGARKVSAGARASTLSALRAATQDALSANTVQRLAVSADLAAGAAVLRQNLAANNVALGAEVQRTLAAARQDLAAKRDVIVENAKALRARLETSRQEGSAAVTAFRGEARADRTAAATTLSASLGEFVAGVRSETAKAQSAVRSQLLVARAAWGHATPTMPVAAPPAPAAVAPKPAPVAAAPAPAPTPVVKTEAAPVEDTSGSSNRGRKRDAEKSGEGEDRPSSRPHGFIG